MLHHDELRSAVLLASDCGEDIIVTAHGIGFAARRHDERILMTQLGDPSNTFDLTTESFEAYGLCCAVPADKSHQHFRKNAHAGI